MFINILFLSAFAVLMQISTAKSALAEKSLQFQDEPSKSQLLIHFFTPAEMDEYINQFPDAQQMNVTFSMPFQESKVDGDARVVVLYTLGYRINGDKIVVSQQAANSSPVPMTGLAELVYPGPSIVTYVTIGVSRSNAQGRAYVLSGGIGQPSIAVGVEIINSLWFNFSVDIYGI